MNAFRVENSTGTYLAYFKDRREAISAALVRSRSGATYCVFEGDSPYDIITYRRGKRARK